MVLIVLAALVGVLAVRGASNDLQMAGSQRVARTGFYCAEAGLNQARTLVSQHYPDWNTILAGGTTAWWPTANTLGIDIDGDGTVDANVTMKDNADEPGTQDYTRDNDLTVILTSTCVSPKYESNGATRTLSQLVTYASTAPYDYVYQAGHSSTHSGNTNPYQK
jgi:hypothetical protein